MVMIRNSAWRKNNRREIRHTWERYIAILAIIALGTGFFAGLKITKTAMVKNLDNYVSEQQLYDYRLLSTLGLTREDVQYFAEQDGITAEGAVSLDFIADIGTEGEVVLKAHSITDSVNRLNISYGRMAEAGNECVLDSQFFSEDIVGSKIRISSANDEDTIKAFAYKEYTVVGIADSVNYLNNERGTTSLANGSVYAFVSLPEDGFSTEYYTEILICLQGNSEVYSEEYKDLISAKQEPLEKALEYRGELRYQDVEDARKKVSDAQKEYEDAHEKYLAEKADAEAELDQAWAELTDADQEIKKQEKILREGERKIAEAEREYHKSVQDYEKALKEYETEKADTLAVLESRQAELNDGRKSIISAISQIEESGLLDQHTQLTETILSLETALSQISNPDSEEFISLQGQLDQTRAAVAEIEATGMIQQYAALQNSLSQLDAGQKEIEQGKDEASRQFAAAEVQLVNAKSQLDSGREQIEKNKQDIRTGKAALEEGKSEYEKGLLEYEDAKEEAKDAFAEAEEELSKAGKEIEDARIEVDGISEPTVHVLDRSYNAGYANFESDSSIVAGIAKVLPIFFFLVAALVCSTTMTRMVDEQRTQIGTLKALGYSNGAIARKYIFYSGSAAVLGCVIGYLLGTKYFPIAIWEAYSMIYGFSPSIEYVFDIQLAVISLVVSLLCSVGVTYISCKNELLQVPAELIRPKAPPAGKRVLLERVPILWNRISFLHKASIRNILRNKRRFFMTVLGIAGCTALVLAALGIGDSIRNIANDQFDAILTYDYNISFSEAQSREEREKFIEVYPDVLSECVFVSTDEVEVVQGNRTKKVSTVATDDPDITKVIGLYLDGETVPYPTFEKAAINDKLAKEFGVTPGDTITIRINEAEMADIEVGGIYESYMGSYLFMTGETYKELFGEEPLYQNAYAATDEKDLHSVSALLSKGDNVAVVSVLNDIRVMVDNMMQSLNYIILLVIACAGALGFVVIYNLNNINIMERSREIATIKVLGFYSRETQAYVFRETIILTVIGALFGLGLGKLLHGFIMNKIDVDAVSFKEQIFGASYLGALLITFMITFLVNLVLKKKIEIINMAESLKSVE